MFYTTEKQACVNSAQRSPECCAAEGKGRTEPESRADKQTCSAPAGLNQLPFTSANQLAQPHMAPLSFAQVSAGSEAPSTSSCNMHLRACGPDWEHGRSANTHKSSTCCGLCFPQVRCSQPEDYKCHASLRFKQ